MRFRQLRYFCKIVECGSFSRAAATIHVAQPALSQQIAELETLMGVELLQRSARGARATRAGEALYRQATGILKQLDQIPSLIRSSGGAIEGSVSLGISSILGPRIATTIVTACREALPKVTLKLMASDSASLRDRVEAQDLDMAIIFENELLLPALSRQLLYRQRLYFVGHRPLAEPSGSLSLAQLAELPLIMPGQSNINWVLFSHALASGGLSPNVVAEVHDVPSLLAAVRAGLGGTVLPIGSLSHLDAGDLPRPALIEPPLYLTASIISDSDTPLTLAGEALRTLLLPLMKRHLESERLPGTEWVGPA
jgi:LysR family transcriptional regulator, nitrogen assimilation regulatory protein